jgi:hypothetical protein
MGVMIPRDIFIIFNRLNADLRCSESASSITIRFHDTPVTFVALLTIVAIINIVRLLEIRNRNNAKDHPIRSKIRQVFFLPKKSVILPAKNEKNAPDKNPTAVIIPSCCSVIPISIRYRLK